MNKEKQYIIIKLCEIEKQIKNLSKEEEHRTILDKIVTIKKSLFEVECLVFNRYLDECNINNLQKQSIQKFISANKIFTINSKYLTNKDL
ncbi:hypothetical protein [Cetobacterium somerae]